MTLDEHTRMVTIAQQVHEKDASPEMVDLGTFVGSTSGDFMHSFEDKAHFMEAALGINIQHSVFIEAQSAIRDNMETSQMELLVKSGELTEEATVGRAITCLDYDHDVGNRFLASYSGVVQSGMESSINIHSDGLINVYDIGG